MELPGSRRIEFAKIHSPVSTEQAYAVLDKTCRVNTVHIIEDSSFGIWVPYAAQGAAATLAVTGPGAELNVDVAKFK